MDIMDIININLTVFYALPDNLICLGEPVFLSKIYIYNIYIYIYIYIYLGNYHIRQKRNSSTLPMRCKLPHQPGIKRIFQWSLRPMPSWKINSPSQWKVANKAGNQDM